MKPLDFSIKSEENVTLDFNEMKIAKNEIVFGICGVKPYTLYEDAYLMEEDYPPQEVFESDWSTKVILVEKGDYYKVVEPKHVIVANKNKSYIIGTEIRDFYRNDKWQKDLETNFRKYVESLSPKNSKVRTFLDPV